LTAVAIRLTTRSINPVLLSVTDPEYEAIIQEIRSVHALHVDIGLLKVDLADGSTLSLNSIVQDLWDKRAVRTLGEQTTTINFSDTARLVLPNSFTLPVQGLHIFWDAQAYVLRK